MVFATWTRPKLLISILNYINSLETVVYTQQLLRVQQRFDIIFCFSTRKVTLKISFSAVAAVVLVRRRFSIPNTIPPCANKAGDRLNVFYDAKQATRGRRMRGVKQHHKTRLAAAFLQHTSARTRRLHHHETNGREITLARSLPFAHYFSASPLLTCFRSSSTHIFFGIMRSFFYGILLSVVCFST